MQVLGTVAHVHRTQQYQATISLNMASTPTVWQHQECDMAKTVKSSSVLMLVL